MVTTPPFPPPRERRARQSPCPRCARPKVRFWTAEYYIYCVSIAKRLKERRKSYFKAYQGCSGTLPPRAPSRHARRARSCSVVHFTCPLVALRFEGTFHVFANVLAKTFHFCAADIYSLTAHYICAKISRPAQGRTLSFIAHCALVQDIS